MHKLEDQIKKHIQDNHGSMMKVRAWKDQTWEEFQTCMETKEKGEERNNDDNFSLIRG